jgi:UDP-N-acetylmuramoyl-tripeptide--D-alanyl-D-alanine ligase
VSAAELAALVDGVIVGDPDAWATSYAIDSRVLEPGACFVALQGGRDGHDFVGDAFARGARVALVGRAVDHPPGTALVVVDDPLSALARLAGHARSRWQDVVVVGITGSAGKTTTKEFVAAALEPIGPVLKTRGNRNSEFTAPLLWAELAGHRAAVVEMAMRGFGQIAHLASFSLPTMGIVTNIGWSHLEMVGSREGIAQAKGELLEALPPEGTALIWAEDDYADVLRTKAERIRTFGFSEVADCRIERFESLSPRQGWVAGYVDEERWETTLPGIGRHIALNAAAAVLAAVQLGIGAQDAATRIGEAQLPGLRMEVRDIGGVQVIVDTYNSAPPAVIAALEALADLPCEGRRLAVLGQMNELGDYAEEAHRSVGRALANFGIEEALTIGELARWISESAAEAGLRRVRHTSSLEDVRAFLKSARPGDLVLVKGSRALGLERALPGGSE